VNFTGARRGPGFSHAQPSLPAAARATLFIIAFV